MKSTGVVRKFDELGRIVIPKEVRDSFHLSAGDPMEVFVDGERIILQKYAPGCVFCQSLDDLNSIWDRLICTPCAKRIAGFGFNERS